MLVSSCAQRTSRPEVEESLCARPLCVVSSRAFTLSEAKGSDLSRPCREGSAVSSVVVAITLSNFVGEGSSPVMPRARDEQGVGDRAECPLFCGFCDKGGRGSPRL